MKDNQKASFGQIFSSVFAAMIGVQSDKNRERDFQASNPIAYIVAGIVFTVGFVASVVIVVNMVVP